MSKTSSKKTKTSKELEKKPVVYSASDARKNLYSILKDAGAGLQTYEVTQRNGQSVVMMSKEDFEGWQETIDIMSDDKLMTHLRQSRKDKKRIPLKEILQELEAEANES